MNGSHSDYFTHKRGLRQGDPLSILLFILAVDVLQRMVGGLNEISNIRLAPRLRQSILALQYADDTAFILSANLETVVNFKLLLRLFSKISGLKVNFQKSAIVPFNLEHDQIQLIRGITGCTITQLPVTYLGLPLTIKTPNQQAYWPLIEKLQNKLQGWQGKLLFRGGRLQLVNSVLSSTLIYFMSCFKLPAWVIARVDKLRRNFLWGKGTDGANGVSWLNWSACCSSKRYGGLGISDIRVQNMALLLRWWCWLYQQNQELWAQTVNSIYSRNSANEGPKIWRLQGSFLWRSLWQLQPFFHWSTQWQVGDGRSIAFWFDLWDGPLIVSYLDTNRPPLSLLSLRQAFPLLQEIAPQMHIEFSYQKDELIWRWTADGTYSSKSFYGILKEGGKIKWPYPLVWQAKAPPTVRIFCFLLLREKVLTRDKLRNRNFNCEENCVLCNSQSRETLTHLLFTCTYAQQVWRCTQVFSRKSLLVRHLVPNMSVPKIWEASWLEAKRTGVPPREWLNGM